MPKEVSLCHVYDLELSPRTDRLLDRAGFEMCSEFYGLRKTDVITIVKLNSNGFGIGAKGLAELEAELKRRDPTFEFEPEISMKHRRLLNKEVWVSNESDFRNYESGKLCDVRDGLFYVNGTSQDSWRGYILGYKYCCIPQLKRIEL